MFGRDWQDGTATIVKVRVKSTTGDGLVSIREFAADVTVPGREPFRTVIQEPRIAMNFWAPSEGDVVRVHADLKRQVAKFDKDDPKIDAKARQRATDDEFDRVAAAPPSDAT